MAAHLLQDINTYFLELLFFHGSEIPRVLSQTKRET